MADGMDMIEQLPDIDLIDGVTLADVQDKLMEAYMGAYEEIAGEPVQMSRADPERLILLACAQVLYQGLQYVDKAGRMNLLKYAYDEYLDNLAALKGVSRIPARHASVQMRFSVSAIRETATAIPEGTVVAAGQEAFFATTVYAEVPAGAEDVVVTAQCTEAGEMGNGYMPGEINAMVSPVGFIGAAANISVSAGGAEGEDDDAFAERIYLAPAGYSTAGPDDAYEYLVRSSGVDVGDVLVTSTDPGTVTIRFTLEGGQMPDDAAVEAVRAYVSQRGRRPLTDRVEVMAPETVGFTIDAEYYIAVGDKAIAETIRQDADEAVMDYIGWQTEKMGRDIAPDELVYRLKSAGVGRVVVREPSYQTVEQDQKPVFFSGGVAYKGVGDDKVL